MPRVQLMMLAFFGLEAFMLFGSSIGCLADVASATEPGFSLYNAFLLLLLGLMMTVVAYRSSAAESPLGIWLAILVLFVFLSREIYEAIWVANGAVPMSCAITNATSVAATATNATGPAYFLSGRSNDGTVTVNAATLYMLVQAIVVLISPSSRVALTRNLAGGPSLASPAT